MVGENPVSHLETKMTAAIARIFELVHQMGDGVVFFIYPDY